MADPLEDCIWHGAEVSGSGQLYYTVPAGASGFAVSLTAVPDGWGRFEMQDGVFSYRPALGFVVRYGSGGSLLLPVGAVEVDYYQTFYPYEPGGVFGVWLRPGVSVDIGRISPP